MKWTLLFLLVLNLGLGGYQYWVSQQQTADVTQGDITKFDNLQLSASQLKRLADSSEKTPVIKDSLATRCIRISGLTEGDSLPIVESRLKALEVASTKTTETVVLRRDYQVILGPFASVELARGELDRISAKGVESYVITSGDNKNALSLGVFSNEANSNRKLDELKSLDIAATTIIKEHTGSAISLIVDRESAALISDSTLQSILSSFETAEFSRFICN